MTGPSSQHADHGGPRSEGARHRTLGIALGSGSARGWAHVGVLRGLREFGLEPRVLAGTSVGAIVGAVCALNRLAVFERWLRRLDRRRVLALMDVSMFQGGFMDGERLVARFREVFGDPGFEDLERTLGVVATELYTGQERWLREGSVAEALRASIALPGLFTPVHRDREWLVDGGLVNPVPVSLCRAMGADVVIAVNLNGDLIGRHRPRAASSPPSADGGWLDRIGGGLLRRPGGILQQMGWPGAGRDAGPGLFEIMATSVNVMQDRITRSRLAGDPPDLVINPRLARIGLLEFDRADEAIDEGYRAVRRMGPALEDVLARLD